MLGAVVGNYKITRQIGAGGMGAVYEAEHSLLGKRAAVKVLLPRMSVDKEIVKRFFNEAKAISLIQHPGVVEVYDYGHLENGNAFIVMELLEGESLGARLKREGKLSCNDSIATARHVAGVLSEAHRSGIIHRDLKPDNVFLVPDAALPRGERAKVLDFGIAKLSGDDEGDKLETKTGQILGTPMYMSPEQCKGAGLIDHRSDIYSLGCLFYQMLCGRPPFLGEGSGEILAAQIHIAPDPIRQHEASVPDAVAYVVMKLLDKDVDKRYQTMKEVIDALNQARPTSPGDTEPSLTTSNEFFAPGDDEETQAMPPVAIAAQMGANTIDSLTVPPPSQARKRFLIGTFVVLLAIAGAIAASSLRGDSHATQVAKQAPPSEEVLPTKTPPADRETPTQPSVVPITEEAPTPPAATVVNLVIESSPPGAKVYRESDGVRLGETPLSLSLPLGQGVAGFLLKKSGYHRMEVELSTAKDGRILAELSRRGSGNSRENNAAPSPITKLPPAQETPKETPKRPAGKDDALDPFSTSKSKEKGQ